MSNESSQSLDSPANEAVMARLLELENRTGYRMQQCNGQRRYWNPNWSGPPPARGTEVFVGKIPRDLFEDEIVPVFEKVGHIYELRLMMDFSGYNRGYAFVTYTTKEDAIRAIELLNNIEIRPGMKIGVCRSVDNCKLFVGSIPKDKSQDEIRQAMCEITEDVTDVIVYPGTNPGELNRGFAFVEYASHRAAAMARRKLIPGRITLFGYEVAVDWADPESDVTDDIANRVKNVYVRNLKPTTSEFTVWAAFNNIRPGSIERVKKIEDRDFAFVHFHRREDALYAVTMMNGQLIDGQEVHVSLAKLNTLTKPPMGNKILGNNIGMNTFTGNEMFNSNAMMNRQSSTTIRNQQTNQPFNMFGSNMSNLSMNSNEIGPMCTVRSFPNRPKSITPTLGLKDYSQSSIMNRTMTPTPRVISPTSNPYWRQGPPQQSERNLRPVLTMDHIAKIQCPVTLLSELCVRLDLGSACPFYTLLFEEQSSPLGQTECKYVYQVRYAGNLYTPPSSSDTIEEAKRTAAQYVIDQIAPWLKLKLDLMVNKPTNSINIQTQQQMANNGQGFSSFSKPNTTSSNFCLSPLFSPAMNANSNLDMKPKMAADTVDASSLLDNVGAFSSFGSNTTGQNYPDYLQYLNTMAAQSSSSTTSGLSMQQ
uniref:uncharacterized protein LOC120336683 n=1 Tax=Styela clava TaxID=7725 RepID=UPI00193974F8|nr:uncharacterized protein LOC120336683 [Styela clava]